MPLIFESSWQGLLFLFTIFIFIILELYLVVKEKKIIKNAWYYNILLIMITMYLSIIYYKIYSIKSSLYGINLSYCKNNYLIISLVFIFIMFNMAIIKYVKKGK